MKYEAYRSPLGALQPSGSYLKIERAIKKVRKKENHKIGEKKEKNKKIGGIKRVCGEASNRKIKRKNLKVDI